MAEFEDFKPSVTKPEATTAVSPVSQNIPFDNIPAKFKPPAGTTGIMDWKGETWDLNSAMAKKLIDIAVENNVMPKYIKEEGNIQIAPKNKVPSKEEVIDTSTDSASGNEFYQQGLTPIKIMQQKLIDVAREIANHNIHDVADRRTEDGEYLTGSNPFMNFLVSSYMNKANPVGKQFVNVEEKMPTRIDTAKENDNFKGVLKTIQQLGSFGAGKEQKADGIWGPRTNNALKQIYSLAYALIELQNDMGITNQSYSNADLTELYSNIPSDSEKININQKVKNANIITNNLNKFKEFYASFREKILNNSNYAAQISQTKPLLTTAPKKELQVDKNSLEQHKDTPVEAIVNGNKLNITPNNLVNLNSFKQFLQQNNNLQAFNLSAEDQEELSKNNPMIVNKLLSQVIDGLQTIQNLQTSR